MDPRLELSTGEDSKTSFSIKLYHALPENTPSGFNNALSMVAADVQAPGQVKSTQLERVEIRMKFRSLKISKVDLNGRSKAPLKPLTFHGEDKYWDRRSNYEEPLQGLSEHQALQQINPELFEYSYSSSGHIIERLICEYEDMLGDETIFSTSNTTAPQPASKQPKRSSLVCSLAQVGCSLSLDEAAIDDTAAASRFDFACACKMADFALRTLVGGRQTRSQPGIRTLGPCLTHPLSEIAPSLWSPGFLQVSGGSCLNLYFAYPYSQDKQAISKRSRFASTISHILSTSLLHNAQSPSLQRKIKGLDVGQSQSKGDCGSGSHLGRDAADVSHRIGQAMQANIWAMMQLCLYDPLAARRLQPSDSGAHDDSLWREDEMLDAPMAERNLELLADKRQSLRNELVDPIDGSFEDVSYDFMGDMETGCFEDKIGSDPGISDDIFVDLFDDDNVVEMGGSSFEALYTS
jgi:hypothetical protein